jgi:hypothetical protein
MGLFSRRHRVSFDHHVTGVKAKCMIDTFIDHAIDMKGKVARLGAGIAVPNIMWPRVTIKNS